MVRFIEAQRREGNFNRESARRGARQHRLCQAIEASFFRYLLPRAHWLLMGVEHERAQHIETHLDRTWKDLDEENARLWKAVFGDAEPAVL
jgi:hypothetical protein